MREPRRRLDQEPPPIAAPEAVVTAVDAVVERRTSRRSTRVFDFPRVRVSAEETDERGAAKELAAWLVQCGYDDLFCVSSRHGVPLTEALSGVRGGVTPPPRADQEWASGLIPRIRASGARVVVAVGGGRCLDAAKYAAAGLGTPVVAVPTQLSHDGICSPVAVLPNRSGMSQSLPAVFPSAVFFSLPTIRRAPARSARAGLGDLLSNPFALRDWELAATRGRDTIDERAWHLSLESAQLVEPWLDGVPDAEAAGPRFLTLLAHALANSGLAMMCAGSSRPASGAEHKISHAIDLRFGGRARHGEQVAFACIVSAALHGLDVAPVQRRLRRLGLPARADDLGLSRDEMTDVLLIAPSTRPGRFTVLEQAGLTRGAAERLVRSL
ncbi:MAG TPA: iron-containing alcohol dehydrogenase [Actinomycetota bacterium]|nr:iron-containing alcohol dehydrogenase [Actinomycetota bacterium]